MEMSAEQYRKAKQTGRMPHKHAELIKAWADGAEIEYWNSTQNKWMSPIGGPSWRLNDTYRIKPETIRYRVALFQTNTQFAISTSTEIEAKSWEKTNKFFVRWLTDWIEVEV